MIKKKTHLIISSIAISFLGILLISYPGHNALQTLVINSNESEVLNLEVDISQDPIPVPKQDILYPDLSAGSAIVVDIGSGVILYEKNSDDHFMPASTTKIMTALVAIDQYNLDKLITIKNEQLSIGSKSHLVAGEQITVRDVIKAMLISSGNDAALALGQHHPNGYGYFISLMNQKAKELHLTNSHFTNVSGLEQSQHYMSARDLAILSKKALENDLFRKTVATKKTSIKSIDGNNIQNLENTNQLLGVIDGVNGVKTGWTYQAGECLVTSTTRDGKSIISVVLKSLDRFGESESLINWAYNSFIWEQFPLDIPTTLKFVR